MSSAAKVFVVLNLILAVAMFASAATLLGAQDDYKRALEDVTKKTETYVANAENNRRQLESDLAQQNARAAQAVAEAAAAKTVQETLTRDLELARTNSAKLVAMNESLQNEVKAQSARVQENQQMIAKLVADTKKAVDTSVDHVKKFDDEVANRVQLESEISQLREQITTLTAERGDLEREVRDLKFENGEYAKRVGPLGGGGRGSAGQVLGVRGGNLVQITVGTKDGVRIGDEYTISRGAVFVGTIRIQSVEKDSAIGIFNTQFKGDGAPPQAGDKASPSSVN
jgi:predicted RNase H-like nuclease (RuvC/YqgF family)